jgi:hypothetical protein
MVAPKEERSRIIMYRTLAVFFIAAVLVMPGPARAVEQVDFEVDTTQNLINLCTAPTSDPLYREAINFCHGYLEGAYDHYKASLEGPGGKRLVCPPNPAPSRNEAIAMFIEWAKAHPQYMSDEAVDTEFRFLMEKWPCKP